MNQKLYTLAVAHSDYPAAEIFPSERAALQRRLELSEVSDSQRDQLLHLFDAGDRNAYEKALNHLESEVSLVCAIEEHELGDHGASADSSLTCFSERA
ncbi:MAG TPA: hypothetical protein VNT79_16200 [Phycisphaerae bacterium]|nr:hypothetical protein [Phycisphaerae bacterium]